jgi:hypothetical protein
MIEVQGKIGFELEFMLIALGASHSFIALHVLVKCILQFLKKLLTIAPILKILNPNEVLNICLDLCIKGI